MVPRVANPCAMPMPKPMSRPHRCQVSVNAPNSVTHFERHQHSLQRWVFDGNRIIKHDHYAVARVALERTAIFDDDLADCRMIVAQQGHYVFRVRTFGETGKATQVAEQSGNFSAMAFELLFSSSGDDQIGHLRRQEPPQPAHALDLADLIRDALFELLV